MKAEDDQFRLQENIEYLKKTFHLYYLYIISDYGSMMLPPER